MRAAVISDTHGILREEVMEVVETCDVVIHAGDIDKREILDKLGLGRRIYVVRGNNDGEWAEGISKIQRFRLEDVEFVMAHNKKDLPWDLTGVDIVVFGHSHKYLEEIRENGRLWLNPGGCGRRRFSQALTMAVLTLEDGKYEVEKVEIEVPE